MGKPQHVLALGFSGRFDVLAGRLLRLNFRAVRAATTEDGVRVLERSGEPIRVALLAVPQALGDLGFAIERLREHAPAPYLHFVATGQEPGRREREELHRAGVEFALWEPFDDAALRFVLNEAHQDPNSGESRNVPRTPTAMLARVFSAAGQKAALVYNLSERGAFLETLRPTSAKGHVRVELPLPTGTVTLAARVVTTNVPGNIQKPNLPMGMGVEFTDVPEEARQNLAEHVGTMTGRYRIEKPEPL